MLDVEYIMSIAQDAPTWFWYLDGDAFILEWATQVK